jgi:16S rRNA (uracil1498-N3)-methyltransferase
MTSEYKAKTRLYLDHALKTGDSTPIPAERRHYLTHVLRLKPGAEVFVFNERSGEFLATFDNTALVLQQQTRGPSPTHDLVLAFAPLKKDATDFLLEKATELGASHLQPVFTDYTNSQRFNADRAIAQTIHASEQCQRLDVPQILPPLNLRDFIATWPFGKTILYADEMKSAPGIREYLASSTQAPAGILIGPEGGFSAKEREFLHHAPGVQPVHLGPRILRAETAAVAALAVLQALAGDWELRA